MGCYKSIVPLDTENLDRDDETLDIPEHVAGDDDVTKGEAQGAEVAAESPVDYMESERVMADPGKDAFNGMEAAVNNAAESVKGLGGELEQAINQAEEKTF